jgi:hypothetical protein
MLAAFAAVMLGAVVQDAAAEDVVARFAGSTSGNTREFEVRAPWLMEWLVSGEAAQYEVIEISLVDAKTGTYRGIAVKSKTAGEGLRLFDDGGRYYFRVNSSMMKWRINVIQLSEQEARRYTARH